MYGYVYLTTNLINGHKYIGQHKSESFDESYKGSGTLVRRAYDKHGWENFKTEVLEWCQSREELNEREKYWISYYDAVNSDDFYNISEGGGVIRLFGEDNPFYGKHHTEEVKVAQSKRMSGRYVGEKSLLFGTHKSEEEKARQSAIMSGRPSAFKGRHHTDESKEKNRQAHLGKPSIFKGKHHTKIAIEKNKRNQPGRIMVRCIETGQVFMSASDAGRFVGNSNKYVYILDSARRYDSGNTDASVYGYHWSLVV